MDRATQHIVRFRAAGLCEYCRLPETSAPGGLVIDHIIAQQHHGPTVPDNLALACPPCNLFKGPNLASLDPPGTGELVRLFNPRRDRWRDHFRWEHATLVGLTSVGRVTVFLLNINEALRLDARWSLMQEGLYPTTIVE